MLLLLSVMKLASSSSFFVIFENIVKVYEEVMKLCGGG